jgi:hypothetical protein
MRKLCPAQPSRRSPTVSSENTIAYCSGGSSPYRSCSPRCDSQILIRRCSWPGREVVEIETPSATYSGPRLPLCRSTSIRSRVTDALPERWVTPDSGHIGNTFRPLRGSAKCRGRSVARWMNGSGSWPGFSMARRWRLFAESSVSPGRPATRSCPCPSRKPTSVSCGP